MTANGLRKRLDAIERRSQAKQVLVFINHFPQQPADGKPYRKTGETIADCQARYRNRSRKQIFVFLNLIGDDG